MIRIYYHRSVYRYYDIYDTRTYIITSRIIQKSTSVYHIILINLDFNHQFM